MDSNILPLIPKNLFGLTLDLILFLLTNSNNLIKRISFLSILLFNFLILYILFHSPNSHLSSTTSIIKKSPKFTSKTTTTRESILNYKPSPPNPSQINNFNRLTSLIQSSHSAYSPSSFSKSSLKTESTSIVGVTAIILNWKRRKGLELVLSHISRYPFIREIIIWNNNEGVDLVPEDFNLYTFPSSSLAPATLRIYNSPSNVHDAGKHIACSLASYEHCYFNDDDWLNIYMDSLYTKYLDCCSGSHSSRTGSGGGGRIVSNTLPIIHLEHRRWRFENPEIELHTGFTWLGTGSFAPQYFSTRFLEQQSLAPEGLDRDQSAVADMFFSLWTNGYPEQMPNDLVPVDLEGGEVGWSLQANVDQWTVVYANILDALQKLSTILTEKQPYLLPSPFPISTFSHSSSNSNSHSISSHEESESTLRAPCANDGCLFMTSLTPFKSPEILRGLTTGGERGGKKKERWSLFGGGASGVKQVGGSGGVTTESGGGFNAWGITHIKDYEALWNSLAGKVAGKKGDEGGKGGWPSDDWWIKKGSWHLAVDGKGLETCWESFEVPNSNDNFGLTFVKPRLVSSITIIGSKELEFFLGAEKSTGRKGWEVLTLGEDASRGWQSRRFQSKPIIESLPSASSSDTKKIKITFRLLPQFTSTRNTDSDEEEPKIRRIKFMLKGGKLEGKLEVCGFYFDGWAL